MRERDGVRSRVRASAWESDQERETHLGDALIESNDDVCCIDRVFVVLVP